MTACSVLAGTCCSDLTESLQFPPLSQLHFFVRIKCSLDLEKKLRQFLISPLPSLELFPPASCPSVTSCLKPIMANLPPCHTLPPLTPWLLGLFTLDVAAVNTDASCFPIHVTKRKNPTGPIYRLIEVRVTVSFWAKSRGKEPGKEKVTCGKCCFFQRVGVGERENLNVLT